MGTLSAEHWRRCEDDAATADHTSAQSFGWQASPLRVKHLQSDSEDSSLIFCRFTQLGLLRLLTTEAVMGDEVMTQPEAWEAYDR